MAAMITDDHIDFSRYLKETDAQQKVRPASLWVQELIDRVHRPLEQSAAVLPWRKTHNLLQFRPGELTVWGGANGNGKSLVTGLVALSLCSQGDRVCIASFEMKPARTLERMGRQWSTRNSNDPDVRAQPEATRRIVDLYEQFRDWTDDKLWLYDQQGTVKQDQVIAMTRYCAKQLGIKHVFIDSLMKCVAGEDDYNGQKSFVEELTSIARDHEVHVHLVHHIKKPESEDKRPNKYDYKGSGAITDQADNVISVWRNKAKERRASEGKAVSPQDPDTLLICDKQRNGEWEGSIGLWFDPASQQFLESHDSQPMAIYLHPGI